jgi:hypothetical protein
MEGGDEDQEEAANGTDEAAAAAAAAAGGPVKLGYRTFNDSREAADYLQDVLKKATPLRKLNEVRGGGVHNFVLEGVGQGVGVGVGVGGVQGVAWGWCCVLTRGCTLRLIG